MGVASSASIRTFEPAVLPPISSSLALFYAFVEITIFLPFLQSSAVKDYDVNRAIQLWWNNFFGYGMSTIISLGIASLVSGIYAARQYPLESNDRYLCIGGTIFCMAHFLFGPPVANIIKSLCDEKVAQEKKTIGWLRSWLRLHYWRSSLTDVPAVACFACVVFG